MTPAALRRAALLVRAVMVLGLAGAAASCHRRQDTPRGAPRLRLGTIELHTASEPQATAPKIDGVAIAARLRRVLLSSGLVVAPAPDAGMEATAAPEAVMRIVGVVATEVVEADEKGLCRAGVSLKITTRPSDAPGAIEDEISATGEERFDTKTIADRAGLAQRVAERTATDLLAGTIARARLGSATTAEVHATIAGDGGVALREEAIRQAGSRGMKGEATGLLALLDDPDESIRDAALGALIALRDQRAVAQLARNRSFRDRREMAKILDAISLIGGEEARQYLTFVAESHDDVEIRQQAREARDRMLRHERDGGH